MAYRDTLSIEIYMIQWVTVTLMMESESPYHFDDVTLTNCKVAKAYFIT